MAALLGKFTSIIPAMGDALIRIRFLQRELALNLKKYQSNWEAPCPLSTRALQELVWWLTWAKIKNGLPIHKQIITPDITIHVDALGTGWGATSKLGNFSGKWTETEKVHAINVRESKTIWIGLKLHVKKFNIKDTTIKIYTDNISALKYASKAGNTASITLQELALKINELCHEQNINVDYEHIAGTDNIVADRLSQKGREKDPVYQWTVPWKEFRRITKR